MPILRDTTIKGDLEVKEDIIENGTKCEDKYCSEIVIENGKIVLKSPSGKILSEEDLPS